jgi:hypothetical protein
MMIPGQSEDESPKPLELRQFDAYLRRELPRTIRKTLQATLESSFGPIEETLKNRLENIVRDAQETLTRDYLKSVQLSDTALGSMAGSSGEGPSTQTLLQHQSVPVLPKTHPETDALSPYQVPSETIPRPWPQMTHTSHNIDTYATISDSTYFSLLENSQNPSLEEVWDSAFEPADPFEEDMEQAKTGDMYTGDSRPALPVNLDLAQGYTGKGKGRAAPEADHDIAQSHDFA